MLLVNGEKRHWHRYALIDRDLAGWLCCVFVASAPQESWSSQMIRLLSHQICRIVRTELRGSTDDAVRSLNPPWS